MSAMGALTAGVAHEVRNPLFAISSTLDAMDARFGGRGEHQRYIDVLRSEVNRMTKLMGDLLEYGKPTALDLAPGSVGDLIAQAMIACTPITKGSGVTITHDKRADLPLILCDHRRLVQAFQNLLENAVHFSPRGGLVTIAAETVCHAGKTWVECAVRDCGLGFKTEDIPHVFEPFFTRRRGGTGLGLAIVLRIVEAHGGSIAVTNRVEGGAIVIVRLPIAEASAQQTRTGDPHDAQ